MDSRSRDRLYKRAGRMYRQKIGAGARARSLEELVLHLLREEGGADGGAEGAAPGREGLVIGVAHRRCWVCAGGEVIACEVASHLAREQRASLAVGDRVLFAEARVSHVLPRRSALRRPDPRSPRRSRVLVANVDRVLIVVAARRPPPKPGLIDRLLVAVGQSGAAPVLVVNKLDLLDDPEAIEPLLGPYRELGLELSLVSAESGRGIGALRRSLAGQLCALVGHSGVGKSSLLNALGGLETPVGEVRDFDGKGRHTTTAARLFDLGEGLRVIDTPGIRSFGLWRIPPEQLSAHFHEFEGRGCRYRDCTHSHEPDCGVIAAVERGAIARARYESYLRILESLSE